MRAQLDYIQCVEKQLKASFDWENVLLDPSIHDNIITDQYWAEKH